MKKYLIVVLGLFAFFLKAHGQTMKPLTPISQLYVVIAEGKKFITYNEILAVKNGTEGVQKTVDFIKPEWIESIQILRGKDATDVYGEQGQNGVVLMRLKNGALAEMTNENKIKFKE